MKEQMTSPLSREKSSGSPFRVCLPGFLISEESGLGDAVKRAIYAVGIKPYGTCDQRAASLNRWVMFRGRAN